MWKVTHVICDKEEDLTQYENILEKAMEMDIPVVDKSFLIELVNLPKIEDITEYIIPRYTRSIFFPINLIKRKN